MIAYQQIFYLFASVFFLLLIQNASADNRTTEPSTDTNPLGFIISNGQKYWVGNYSEADFFDAKRRCQLYGLDLVSINSQDEYDLLTKTLVLNEESNYWTSGNRINDLKNWVWANGVPMVNTRWAPDEPNDNTCDDVHELCVALGVDGLEDWRCKTKFHFVCEGPH